jgi:spore coat protein SA
MHICIVAPEQIPVPPILGGSVEICIYSIAQKLAKHNLVTIISRMHTSYKRITHDGNITIIRVPTGSQETYLAAVLKAISGKQFDLIQVDNRPRFAAAIKSKHPSTPLSLFLHSLTFITPPKASISATAKQLAIVDLIIVNSSSMESQLSRLFPEEMNKVHKIHLGVDLNRFRPPSSQGSASAKRKFGLSRGRGFHVLFVGRLIPLKGVPILIKAVGLARKKVPHIKLLIAGGAQRKRYLAGLRNQARIEGVPVKFLGKIAHSKLHRIYWLGDCLVCPSQKHEAFGLVNVEALASGLPVIASNNGGIKEIVKPDENGYLIKGYHDPSHFAEKIVALAKRKSLAQLLGMQARIDAVNRFSWDGTADSLIEIYRMKASAGREAGKNG